MTRDSFTILNIKTPTILLVPNRLVAKLISHRISEKLLGHHHIYFFTPEELAQKLNYQKCMRQGRHKLDLYWTHEFARAFFKPFQDFAYSDHIIDSIQQMYDFGSHPQAWFKESKVAELVSEFIATFSEKYFTPKQLMYEVLFDQIDLSRSIFAEFRLFILDPVQWTQLERTFFQYLSQSFDVRLISLSQIETEKNYSVSSFESPDVEAQALVKKVILNQSVKPKKNTAILFRSFSDQSQRVIAYLKRSGVHFYVDGDNKVSQHVIGHFIQESLDLVEKKKLRKKTLNALCKLPFNQAFMLTHGQTSQWEEWTSLAHISSFESSTWKTRLTKQIQSPQIVMFSDFLDRFLKLLQSCEGHSFSIKLFMGKILQFLSPILDTQDDEIASILKSLDHGVLQLPEWVFRLSAIEQRALASRWISRLTCAHHSKPSTLVVSTYARVQGLDFERLYLPSLSSSSLPKKFVPHSLCSESATDRAKQFFTENEQILFLQTQNASDDVFLSYSEEPSSMISSFDLPTSQSQLAKIAIDEVDWISLYGKSMSPFIHQSQQWLSKRIHHDKFTSFDGNLSSFELPSMSFSASFFETFAECPYKNFLKYFLKVDPVDDPESETEISALDRGNFVHEILDRYFKVCIAQGSYNVDLLEKIALKVFLDFETTFARGLGLFWELEKKILFNDLKLFLKHDSNTHTQWLPQETEVSFTNLDVGTSQRILLRGKIDRIDQSAHGQLIRIIDYKTGNGALEKTNSYKQGKRLQLAIYLLAVSQKFPTIPLENIDGELLFTSLQSGFKRFVFEGSHFIKTKSDFIDSMNSFVKQLYSGAFFQNPEADAKNCRNCQFLVCCGPDVEKVVCNKIDDSLFKSFVEAKGRLA